MKYLSQPDNKEEAKPEVHNFKNNVQGLLLYHPRDRENAQKQMAVLHLSIKNILERVYKLMSHSFHVLLQDLIPHARQDNSSLFTHIKGARIDHMLTLPHPRQDNSSLFMHIKGARIDRMLTLRAHHNKKRDESLPDLEVKRLNHTLHNTHYSSLKMNMLRMIKPKARANPHPPKGKTRVSLKAKVKGK